MTGGRVVVLGRTGRNFGAGMSGGVAYVLDEHGDFPTRVNTQMVGVERLEEPEEVSALRALLQRHLEYTGSSRARSLLAKWDTTLTRFVKIMPKDYQRMLSSVRRAHDLGLTGEEAIMAAFDDNARDVARLGGN